MPLPPDCRKRNDFSRPVARIDLGGVQDPKKVNLTPISLLQKPHFVAKSGPFGRFGGCTYPRIPWQLLFYLFIYWFIDLLICLFISTKDKTFSVSRLGQKKKNCCIGVTRPTLILPPTLDIFIYLFFFLRRKNKNKSIIMYIKVGKPQNMQLYVRRKVKMFRSPILLCGYGLCVQV